MAELVSGGVVRRAEAPGAARGTVGRGFTLAAAIAMFFDGALGVALRARSSGVLAPEILTLHRTSAVAVAGLVLGASLATFLEAPRRLRRLALLPPFLVGVSALLGSLAALDPGSGARIGQLALQPVLLLVLLAMLLIDAPASSSLLAPADLSLASVKRTGRALVELTKPRVSGLVVATFAGGVWLAPGKLTTWRAWVSLLGTVLIVGAANALNMYLERDIDGRMARTSRRPLPQGRVSSELALSLGVSLACLATPLLFLGGNALVGALGLIAFVSYVFIYTPLKQRSPLALWVGALPGAMPPLMGWAAARGRLDAPGLLLFAVLFLWQIPHFIAIAVYRAEDYTQAGFRVMTLESHPVAARVNVLVFTVATVIATALLGPLGVTGWLFALVAVVLGARFLWRALGAFSRFPDREAARTWARGLFFESITYLGVLFVAIAADHLLR